MKVVVLALVLATAIAGCATGGGSGGMSPSASVTTTTAGWEHYFKLDWAVEPSRDGSQKVSGYVHNQYGRAATRMQMLAQALDPQGNLVGQRLAWVPGTVPPLDRAYFAIDGLPAAEHYRVTVWSWDFIETPGRWFP
jgi:hypothetical protein